MTAADHELPSEIILLDILSRIPVKSLARFRCVSKQWCEYINNDPYFKMFHGQRSQEEPLIMVTARNHDKKDFIDFIGVCAIESSNKGSNILNAPLIESYKCKWKNNYARDDDYTHSIIGSCNGLVYLARSLWGEHSGCFMVVDPLRKEFYELPPTDDRLKVGPQGLGFDDSTNTFKMVHFTYIPMLHVFGTNSWRPISQVPPNIIHMFYDVSLIGAVFAGGGCLHWLAYFHESKIISLDMKTEKFRLIDLPDRQRPVKLHNELVDLNGEVGCVFNSHENHCLEVWVLKQKKWVIHCRIVIISSVRRDDIRVLGCWNKDGDILMSTRFIPTKQWFIYTRKSGVLKEVKFTTKLNDIRSNHLCPSSLFSLHGIKAYSIKK